MNDLEVRRNIPAVNKLEQSPIPEELKKAGSALNRFQLDIQAKIFASQVSTT